jgi:hypothetical protein
MTSLVACRHQRNVTWNVPIHCRGAVQTQRGNVPSFRIVLSRTGDDHDHEINRLSPAHIFIDEPTCLSRYRQHCTATLSISRSLRVSVTMISARVLPRSVSRVASSSSRFLSTSIEVEHGRGQWKTYGDVSNYTPGKYQIKTFNKVSPLGLARFPGDKYEIRAESEEARNAHAILMRSYKLKEEDVPHTVRAIAR